MSVIQHDLTTETTRAITRGQNDWGNIILHACLFNTSQTVQETSQDTPLKFQQTCINFVITAAMMKDDTVKPKSKGQEEESSTSTCSTVAMHDSLDSFGSSQSFASLEASDASERAEHTKNAITMMGKHHLKSFRGCKLPEDVLISSTQTIQAYTSMIHRLIDQTIESKHQHEEILRQKSKEYDDLSEQYKGVIKAQQMVIRKLGADLSKSQHSNSQNCHAILPDELTSRNKRSEDMKRSFMIKKSIMMAQISQEKERCRQLEDDLRQTRKELHDMCAFIVAQDRYTCEQEARVKELESKHGLDGANK